MPEDSPHSNPPKLKLKSAGESTPQAETTKPSQEDSATPKREPIIKIPRPSADDDLPDAEPESKPNTTAADQAFDPKHPFSTPPTPKPAPIPSPAPRQEQRQASPMPAPKSPVRTPQPAAAPPTRPAVEPLPERSSGSNMMGSLFMIFALILVLGGGGYAIWMVLSEGPTDAAEETQSDADTSKAGLNPIEKAKAAIAKIPFLQTEEVVNEGTTSEAASPPAGITLPTEPAPKPDTTVAPTVNLASNTGEIDNSLTSSVTDFLADLHIGGVRSGSNARIMLNGESYGIGDVVDSQTELHFIGTQAGKLLFRDKNGIVYAKTF